MSLKSFIDIFVIFIFLFISTSCSADDHNQSGSTSFVKPLDSNQGKDNIENSANGTARGLGVENDPTGEGGDSNIEDFANGEVKDSNTESSASGTAGDSDTENSATGDGWISDIKNYSNEMLKSMENNVVPMMMDFSDKVFDTVNQNMKQFNQSAGELYEQSVKGTQDLLNTGIDARDENGYTALMRAISNPEVNMREVRALLDKGASIHHKNNEGDNILMLAISNKVDRDVLNVILDQKPNFRDRNNQGHTALIKAVLLNQKDHVLILINKGAELDFPDNKGNTALFYAVSANRLEMTILLINLRANLYAVNNYGATVFLKVPSVEMAELLKEQGFHNIDTTDQNGNTLLIQTEDIYLAKWLVNQGANIFHENNNGFSALSTAVARDNIELADFLIKSHFKQDFLSKEEKRSVSILNKLLPYSKSQDMINFLLEKKVDIDSRDDKGNTLFLLAVERENFPLIDFLALNGADINASNIYGETALIKAVKAKDFKLIDFLLILGADINAKGVHFYNTEGETALMIAVKEESISLFSHLLERGADPQIRDRKGENILMLAIRTKNRDMIEFIALSDIVDLNAVNNNDQTAQDIGMELSLGNN